MIQEGKLTVKDNLILFVYNEEVSAYQSQLTIMNQSQHALYFKIVSTFGKLLSIQNGIHKKIQPSKTLIFNLKLKIPNQIKNNQEFIRISYSNKEISSKIKFFDDSVIDVKITFDQNVPEEDQMIAQILKDDCQELCKEASEFLKNGLIKRALDKYDESFLLYRQHGHGLYGMAQCYYLMQDWKQAADLIETSLLMFEDQKFIWLKLKILFELYKDEVMNLNMIRSLKKNIESLTEVENNKQKKKQMIEYLKKEEEKLMKQKGGKLLSQFIEKALTKYDKDPVLKSQYKSVQQFESQILQVLGMHKPHTIEETPQYVLDPITYVIFILIGKEIMKQPVIVPSGHSYEPNSLLVYLAKHGNKDLLTRQQLRYEWAKPNNALKKFIKQNQHLNQWIEYEKQITTFK